MAAIDGQFDPTATLGADNTVVDVGGKLTISDGLDFKLRFVVVDAEGNRAEGNGTRDGAARWKGRAAVTSGPPLKKGGGIAYGSAVGTDVAGITTYQWHSIVTLKE